MGGHLHWLLKARDCNVWLRDVPGHTRQHVVGVRQECLKRCALRGLLRQRQAQPLDLQSQQKPGEATLAVRQSMFSSNARIACERHMCMTMQHRQDDL